MINRIDRKFKELRGSNKKAFIAFITAGYPSLDITEKLVLEFSKSGVDIIELGVPFSDPMADGPIIQESSEAALRQGVYLKDILELVKRVRRYTDIPIALMTYYNIIFCFKEERFIKIASGYGVDGVIIPDLPPEEGRSFIKLADRHKLDVICFVSPTTSRKRIKYISKMARGFIYYISLTGVTGPRQNLPPELIQNLREIKKIVDKPVCVGFGVSTPEQIRRIWAVADGVIVGSAIVKKIKENLNNKNLVKNIGKFILYLRQG